MTAIEDEYLRLTPGSAQLMERAAHAMPRGLTRTLSWFAPYPVAFDRGQGARLTTSTATASSTFSTTVSASCTATPTARSRRRYEPP